MVLSDKFLKPCSQYPVRARAYLWSRLSLVITLAGILAPAMATVTTDLQATPAVPATTGRHTTAVAQTTTDLRLG